MKVAIIHDDLMRRGGAEQVTLAMHQAFPDAPIYTLCYQPELTYPEFKNAKIITSWYQKFVKTEAQMKAFFYPFGFWAMRLLKVKGFDKVILSSTYASKFANIEKGTQIINYCHNPFRLAWYPDSYLSYQNSKGLKRFIYNLVISRLKKIDLKYSIRCDKTIVNSQIVKNRVNDIYGFDPQIVINPPVNLSNFRPSSNKSDHYLVVSRLETYKLVDLVIKTFNMIGKKLVIIGNGSQKAELKKLAATNIIFKHNLSKIELANEYAIAKALIFPQFEDFGITPLEANASGIPVIAFGDGGVLETIIPYPEEGATGLFFQKQTTEALKEAIKTFEQIEGSFSKQSMIDNAKRFSEQKFSDSLKSFLEIQ